MLETFDWTDDVVLDTGNEIVKAAIDPSFNMLGRLTIGAIFGFVLDGENAILRHKGFSHYLAPGSYFVVNSLNGELISPGGWGWKMRNWIACWTGQG